jgi:transposase
MGSQKFSQEQKLAIMKNAAEIGFKEAAKIAGVHYTTVYDWQRDLKSLGQEAFLAYPPSYPGRGIKAISAEKEAAVLDCWKSNPGFGPGQVRGKLRRQSITVSIRSIRKIMQANGYAATGKNRTRPNRNVLKPGVLWNWLKWTSWNFSSIRPRYISSCFWMIFPDSSWAGDCWSKPVSMRSSALLPMPWTAMGKCRRS